MKHCEDEAGPSCALAVSEKIPAGSTHASAGPYGPNTAEGEINDVYICSHTRQEREFSTAHLCIRMQQTFSEKSLPLQSIDQ